jgi:hypothetical protein
MPNEFKIFFDQPIPLRARNIQLLIGTVGLYFIFTENLPIPYPFKSSRLLYIGMSERKSNGIGKRLINHHDGGHNIGLKNYRKGRQLNFTILNFEMIRQFWGLRIEDLESYFILDFVKKFGVFPICNNRSGSEIYQEKREADFMIDWDYFS